MTDLVLLMLCWRCLLTIQMELLWKQLTVWVRSLGQGESY